jgi:hypothetical protein
LENKNILINYLTKKCPERIFWHFPITSSLIVSLCIFIILFCFLPFKLSAISEETILWVSLFYTFICGFTTYGGLKLAVILKGDNWTILKDMILASTVVLVISLLIYVSTYPLNNYDDGTLKNNLESLSFLESIWYTLIIGSILYFIIFSTNAFFNSLPFLKKSKHYRSQPVESLKEDPAIKSSEVNKIIELTGRNKTDKIILCPHRIVCVHANGNYLEVIYKKSISSKIFEREILRNSITEIWKSLEQFPFLFNPHRSHIINLEMIDYLGGNNKSKHAMINFINKNIKIPISRTKVYAFNQAYNKVRK